MVFEIVPLNPIRFTDALSYDFKHSHDKCYWQKFERLDSTQIQILSEDPIMDLTLHDFNTDEEIHSFPITEIPTLLVGQPFRVFESLINWSDVGEGRYYLKLWSSEKEIYSEPIWVADEHPQTLLFRYRNSENNYSVVFDTEIIFTLRVEGDIQDFTPRFDDEIYNDQKRNASKLSSIPFREFTLYVGAAQGLPDWMTDKVNRVMSCDMIQIDSEWYEKMPDAEWEIIRQDNYPFAGMQLSIMPTNNLYLQRLKFQTDDPDDDMANTVILRRSENRWNVSGAIAVTGIFKSRTVLIYLRILRRSAPFTFRIGITNGGAEIGEFDATEQCGTYQVRYPFEGVQTVFVTGIGNDSDVSIVYEQLDEVGGGDGGVIPPAPQNLGVGAMLMYEQPVNQFSIDFDMVTGLGRLGTPWQGWAICNGQNGTVDMSEAVAVGWSQGSSTFGTLGDGVGANQKPIPVGALPAHSHTLVPNRTGVLAGNDIGTGGAGGSWANGANGISRGNQGNGQALLTNTSGSTGNGNDFNVMQKSVVLAYVKKIAI